MCSVNILGCFLLRHSYAENFSLYLLCSKQQPYDSGQCGLRSGVAAAIVTNTVGPPPRNTPDQENNAYLMPMQREMNPIERDHPAGGSQVRDASSAGQINFRDVLTRNNARR